MKRPLIIFVFFVLLTVNAPAQVKQIEKPLEPPADFVGDGCSMFPDGDYGDCCLAHDRDYFRGGTRAERKASDARLYRCVRSKGGSKHKFIASIMWLGTRVFGAQCLPTSFRWGFGQRKKRG